MDLSLTPAQLLERHNPILIMLPQDLSRHRPWIPWRARPDTRCGDYHPCSAEFFLSYVLVRQAGPRPWIQGRGDQMPLGLETLRKVIETTHRTTTRGWEIDVAPIPSQKPGAAWQAYRDMVPNYPGGFVPTVYGHVVHYPDRLALQYWYLYAYNDAGNYHEGDWEMAVVELDANSRPLRAGYSGHQGGFRRPWERVEKVGDRPLIYVARGSHAAYFEHARAGHRTKSLSYPKGLPWLPGLIVRSVQRWIVSLIVWLHWNDRTTTHPDYPGDEAWNRGEFVQPDLVMLPRIDEATADGPFWWMNILCRWGSSHSRLRGTAAPFPAWEQAARYDDPLTWLEGLG